LLRPRDSSYVPIGADWCLAWINPQLHTGPAGERAAQLVAARLAPAQRWTRAQNASAVLANKTDVVKDEAFSRWFPVQKEVATWFGDTRVAPDGRRLISDAQLHTMQGALKPGDVIVERRNWYLSNVGLPGFWPHAALYVGTQDDVRAALDDDAEVRARYGGAFSEHLAHKRSAAWAELGKRDGGGHPQVVVEAISEGVVTTSLEHSCGADYVAVMRPRLPPIAVARAIDRALSYFGRPYDFDFDFATDDSIVCSELVMKAYEPTQDLAGLRVPWITVAGRRAVPPTEIVRVFEAELGTPEPQLDFVWFLDGRERDKAAVVADAAALAGSVHRPKWDIAQP
ncbi:MAG: YiiX/YebB-like N1pC/P60 family cysteine hydrolase, partial [Polyangiaceae bacterium]